MTLLKVENLSKAYGGVQALSAVSLKVRQGLVNSLIGPNGAGKTTLFNIVTGIERPTDGNVYFQDQQIVNRPAHHIVKMGIARTFQNLKLFDNMTVLENVMTGLHLHTRSNFFSSGFRLPRILRQEKETIQESEHILDLVGIADKAGLQADELPYGQQRLLEIARALASKPRLLLLDEPAAGMNAKESDILAERILSIKRSGVTVFLVEHDMGLVMMISDLISVLNYGLVIAQGSPEQIRTDPNVIRSYLGSRTTRRC